VYPIDRRSATAVATVSIQTVRVRYVGGEFRIASI
jgi:hypothetical protein